MNEQTKARIKELQKEKDVVILAHYYVDGEVQEIADYVGDSYYLAKVATTVEQQNILFCGVSFMGESAKLLNAKKHVYMADDGADCPMAHMAEVEKIEEVRKMRKSLNQRFSHVKCNLTLRFVSQAPQSRFLSQN